MQHVNYKFIGHQKGQEKMNSPIQVVSKSVVKQQQIIQESQEKGLRTNKRPQTANIRVKSN